MIYDIKDDTMNESESNTVTTYCFFPRDSKRTTNREIVILGDGSLGMTDWTCFHVKDNRTLYLDSLVEQTDKVFLKQLPKTNTFHNYYKSQCRTSISSGTYC